LLPGAFRDPRESFKGLHPVDRLLNRSVQVLDAEAEPCHARIGASIDKLLSCGPGIDFYGNFGVVEDNETTAQQFKSCRNLIWGEHIGRTATEMDMPHRYPAGQSVRR